MTIRLSQPAAFRSDHRYCGNCWSAYEMEGKKLTGDSIFYDRVLGYGEAFDNVQMNDTINRNMLTGNYCFYNEITGSALNNCE